MRPRPDAAENAAAAFGGRGRGARFNEAAARCRGKRFRLPVARFVAVGLQ